MDKSTPIGIDVLVFLLQPVRCLHDYDWHIFRTIITTQKWVAFLISSRIAFVSNRRIRILLDERKQASWFLAPKIEEDSQRKSDFIFHLANHSTFLHVSLGVISLCGPWGGMHLEIGSLLSLINTIVISTVLLASLAFYCKDEVMIPIHIACGGNLKDEVADFLQYFFPDGY